MVKASRRASKILEFFTRLPSFRPGPAGRPVTNEAISAVFGGAVAAAGISLILRGLGAGAGLSEVSPWSKADASAEAGVWRIVHKLSPLRYEVTSQVNCAQKWSNICAVAV